MKRSEHAALSADNGAVEVTSGSETFDNLNEVVSLFIERAKIAAEDGAAVVSRTARENPALAVTGAVAVGALITTLIYQRRAQPRSLGARLQRDGLREARALRNAVRQGITDSGLGNKFDTVGSNLSSIDWAGIVQPFLKQVSAAADAAKGKITEVAKG